MNGKSTTKTIIISLVVQGQCQSSQEIFHMQDDALYLWWYMV